MNALITHIPVSRTAHQHFPLWIWVGASTLAHICLLNGVHVENGAPVNAKDAPIEVTINLSKPAQPTPAPALAERQGKVESQKADPKFQQPKAQAAKGPEAALTAKKESQSQAEEAPNLESPKGKVQAEDEKSPTLYTGTLKGDAINQDVKDAEFVAQVNARSKVVGPRNAEALSDGSLRNPEPRRLNPKKAYLPGSSKKGDNELLAMQSDSVQAKDTSKRRSAPRFDPELHRGKAEFVGEKHNQGRSEEPSPSERNGKAAPNPGSKRGGQDAPKAKYAPQDRIALPVDKGLTAAPKHQPMMVAGLIAPAKAAGGSPGEQSTPHTTQDNLGGRKGALSRAQMQKSNENTLRFAAKTQGDLQWGGPSTGSKGLDGSGKASKATLGNPKRTLQLVGDGQKANPQAKVDTGLAIEAPASEKHAKTAAERPAQLAPVKTTATALSQSDRMMLKTLALAEKSQSDIKVAEVEAYQLIGLSDYMGTQSVLEQLNLGSGSEMMAQRPDTGAASSSSTRSNNPLPVDALDGVDFQDEGGVIPVSGYAIENNAMPGLQVTALLPGGQSAISAKKSEYWPYFTDVNRRITRAWGKYHEEHRYFNLQNDKAWIEVELVVNRRGKIENIRVIRRSGTALDQAFTRCLKTVKFRRFPRRYAPDSFTFRLKVHTTGR